MIVFPNAKINLGLFITEKRTDGFHNLESLFLPIPLCDILEVTPATEDTSLVCTGESSDIPTEKNIVYKAWKLLQEAHGIGNVHIHLHKIIPSGAGMGGGSSDGSFMLKALNELFQLNLSVAQLEDFAAQLGSDCPFFIKNKAALVTGRGEGVDPIDFNLEGKYLVIVNPGIHISTAQAFQGIQPKSSQFNWKEFIQNKDFEKVDLRNDFEQSVFQLYPEIAEIKSTLLHAGALYSSMSGTGSTVYALFDEEPQLCWAENYFSRTFLL
ncbi:MAG: 4-diphosphocytidyl-2-C-methyl-D-erythritol kinase [Bacteroidota bacterium]|jgi:4-diphosphocytidyl-2-C-methyl-D-erythritol kinase